MRIRRRRSIAEINVVPYIDVMLVLVVILMVTAPLMTQGVQVDLPQAQAKSLPTDKPLPVIVTVNREGQLFLSIMDDPAKAISTEVVQAEIIAAVLKDPERPVLVRGDRSVMYESVLDTMVLLQQSGVSSVGLETNNIAEQG
jgi:biopolymer transport protein TolR